MSPITHHHRIALLLAWAAFVQAWAIARNPVPAQDAIPFIQFARQFEYQSIVDALRSNSQHPLYPMLTWGMHSLANWSLATVGESWVRSAQVVAGTAAVLLVIPMYLAGIRLTSATLSMAAVGLFSVLPVAGRMGADALGDSTYLMFMLTAIAACLEFLETGRGWWLFLAGVAVGIGFLVRPETLLVPVAMALTLSVVQFRTRWRMRWVGCVGGVAWGLAGLICVAGPYSLTVGKLTPKGSLNLIPGGSSLFARFDANLGRPVQRTLSDGQSIPVPVQNTVLPVPQDRRLDFSLNHRPAGQRFSGHVAAAKEVLRELVEGLNYFLCPIVFLGAFAPQRKPANLLVTTLAVIFLVVLVQFASRSGYVSSRHVIILVCFACFVAARGGGVLVEWLARAWNAGVARVLQPRLVEEPSETRPNVCAIALFGVAVICCMPRAIGRFHPSRQAHVVAGRWLLEHAATGSMVLDSRGWASLYSGLPSYDYNGARLAFENPNLAYVVVEGSELTDDRPRGQTLRYLLGLAGQMVAEFPGEAPSNESVKIFAWHADRIEGGMAQGAMKAN